MTRSIILQDVLKGSGNSDPVESVGDIRISGSGASYATNVEVSPAAGSTIADATQLVEPVALVDPVASGRGVILPSYANTTGRAVRVRNLSTSLPLKVYAPSGQTIINSTSGDAFTLLSNMGATFIGYSATKWFSDLSGGIGKF